MLPTFLINLNGNMQQRPATTEARRCCCTVSFVLLSLILVLHSGSSSAEKDFNFNDSQVPLLEPKDEPMLIEYHISASSGSDKDLHQHHPPSQHHEHDPYAAELSHCRFNDNEILLSLVLKNYNWHDFNGSRNAKVLDKLSQFFAIPKEFITMESVTKHEMFEMQKESLKRGNNKCHNNNRKLGRVNFIIGCGSKYFTVTEPIAKQIGQQVRDGALDNITGEKFGWWVIWRKQNKSRAARNRRQIEGSGDDEDDEEYYDYDDDTEDTDSTTSTTHAHRHHHGDETSEINSNMLEVASNNKDLQNNANNKISDDITALKQTDPGISQPGEAELGKPDAHLSLLNKKSNIDEEIVESVSQLESVITKTIENTKNFEEVPDIVVDQPVEDLLSEVLQPLSPLEGMDITAHPTKKLNLNSGYEKRNELVETDGGNTDFSVAEFVESLTPSAATSSIYGLATANTKDNQSAAVTLSVVNGQENIESYSDSTTPFSLTSNINKNINNDLLSSSSPSSTAPEHSHPPSQSLEPLLSITEITTFMPHSHLTATILNDSIAITTTHTPLDFSPTFSTSSSTSTPSFSFSSTSSLSSSSSPALSSSSSSSSSSSMPSSSFSTMSSTVSKKHELSPNATTPIENRLLNRSNNVDDVEQATADEQQRQDLINANVNEELLNTLTTIMAMPAVATNKSEQMMAATTEPQESQQQQHRHHYHHHQRQQYYPSSNDNFVEMLKTKPTTLTSGPTNMPTSSSSSLLSSLASSSSLEMLGIATTLASSLATAATTMDTIRTTTPSLETLTPSTLELPIENVFEINNYGKKDENTVEPKENQESSKFSTSTAPNMEDVAASASTQSSTGTPSQATTTPAPSTTPDAISSSSVLPDYIEPKMENTPPIIKSRLQKMAVTSGKSFKIDVPEDTFYDNEDLTNLRLELTDKEGRELKPNSWLQFNAETKEIYGLPLDDAVSKWQYRLTATDSGNESITETLEISVQQHRGVRTVNHEINVSVKINDKNIHYIDWQLNLINAIASTLGDNGTSSIVVREIRASSQDANTATLVYFNETLPTSECPERDLNNLVQRLDVNRLSDLVQPILGIKSLTGQLIGPCQKTASAKPKTPTLNIKNVPPVPRNQVDRVVATVGHLLVYKVPSDTFFDPNDNELTLSLKTKDHKELSPRHWLQFDSKNEEFYGIPKSGDIGSEEYMLVAEDAGGLTATDALVVQVNHAPKRDFSAYSKAYLAIRHEQFNADLQRKFVERIAHLFGDASTQNIQIRSVTTHHDSDGTIVNFYNTTLFKSHNRCPEEELDALRNVYFQDYSLRESVRRLLGPELNITNVQVIPLGTCNTPTDVTHREFVPNKTEEPLLKSTFSEDNLYTIILPAIIIISMILIASLIACCLHRRRRKSGKMELGDEEERKSFRTKGIPVIFQDELDEKPEIGNKSPIILKDEKPPLLPPSYNTSNMNGDNDVDEYVPPPAVVVGGREARGKSPATPSYRKPPPYVSP